MESAASYSLEEPQDAIVFVSRVLDEALENEEETSLEAKISSVSMKLQIMSADLSEEVERCMSELLEASLRAGGEASQIVRLLDGVSEEAKGLAGRASRQLDSGDEAETLTELETTRANMAAVQVILCASNEWEALCSEVKQQADAFLGSQHVDIKECRVVADMIAQRLMPAERALREVSGAETRKRTLETVIEDVETALRPLVASAIRDDAALLKELVGIYDQLDLSESLRRDYASARPAALHRRWFARPRSADKALLGPWLRSFLDDALHLVALEITHCREVFGAEAAGKVAAMTARAIFAPLASSFAERLELCREVEDVAACRDMCMSFAHHVQVETGCSDADYSQVAMAVAGPPFDHVDYAALETQHLVRRATVVCSSNDDVGAVLANAKATLQALFSTELTAGASRCLVLTGGLGGARFGGGRDAAAIAFGRSLCLSLETLRDRYVRDDLPLDTSLLSDCWARAKQAFGAISLAGKLETTLADRSASGGHAIREWCEVLLDDDEQPSSTFAVRYARQLLRRDKRIKLQIENLLATGAAQSPLDKVKLEKCLDELNAAANSLVFELAFSPIRAALRRLSSKRLHDNIKPISYCRPAAFCGGQPADHPNEYVTVVGNHLLAALHELEPFLASDAVRDVIHHRSALAARIDAAGRLTDGLEWSKLGDSLELSDGDRLGLRSLLVGRPIAGVTLGPTFDDDDVHRDFRNQEGSQRFCNDWLETLFRATVAALIDEVIRLDAIDQTGSARLANDISYLTNVAAALDLPKHAVLSHLRVLATTPSKMELDAIVRRNLPENSPAATVLRKVESTFATARARGDIYHL